MMAAMMTIKQGGALTRLMTWSRDPQSWISTLAVVTLLGLASGTFESADSRPADQMKQAQAQAQASPPADEQVASLDTGKL